MSSTSSPSTPHPHTPFCRPRNLPELALPDPAASFAHDAAPCIPQQSPKRPVSATMAAPNPPTPPRPSHAHDAPHSPSSKSPVHKRRRVASDQSLASAESAAAMLREAVRAACAEAASPNSRQNRVSAVYASFRQRAMASNNQHKHQLCILPNSASQHATCSHGPSASCCGHARSDSPSASQQSPALSTRRQEPEQQQQQQQNQQHHQRQQRQQPTQQPLQQPPQQQQQQPSTSPQPTPSHSEPPPSQLEKPLPSPQKVAPGGFPGKGTGAGCEHYERNCWIKAACCNRYYACRRCHDEAETHEIDRHATEYVGCIKCGEADQPVAKNCRSCGVEFARYFCATCKFYDDRLGKDAYHCDGCGICRVGKGLGIDNHHCYKCGNCVPIESKDNHPCTERSLDANCPICTEHLGTSTESVVFMRCGHSIHVDCLNRHTASSYKCPICQKCVTDMSEWFRQLDERLARDVMPPEYARRRSLVYCHDCEQKSTVVFHFVYHKCVPCGGYNTRVLHQFDTPVEQGAESGGESARAAVAAAPRRAALRNLAAGEATT